MRKETGFSLIETLIVMALMGFVMMISGSLIKDFSQASKDQEKTPLQMVVDNAFTALDKDLSAAYRITELTGTTTPQTLGPRLTLELVNIKDPSRFPVLPDPAPLTWDGDGATFIQVVRYEIRQGELVREQSGTSDVLLSDAQSLSFELESPRVLTTELTYLDNRSQERKLTKKSFLFQELAR